MPEEVNQCNSVNFIIAYEQGDLSDEQTIELFRFLKKSGLVNQLQGHYGRTLRAIESQQGPL